MADYKKTPDAELVTMAQGGDTRAFDELVTRYDDKVYRLAYKIVRNEEDASDVLQDAFLSAFKGLKNFKAESTFSTWLYRVTTNAALMKVRKRRDNLVSLEQSQNPDRDGEPLAIPDWSQQPLEDLLDDETMQVILDAVQQLPTDLQVVFVERDELEQSNQEVADKLGISVAAVKSRLHRARVFLRDRLNRYFQDRTTRPRRSAQPG